MKKILLLICIIGLFTPATLHAQDRANVFRHGKLDNGLTYYVRHTSMQPGKADFYLVQNVGALMEEDETVYYMTAIPTNDTKLLDSCLLVMKDWSGFLLLKPDEIDKERGVIREERRIRRNLGARLKEQSDPLVFNNSKYATRNVIGSEKIARICKP